MLFNSLHFLIFFPIVTLIYYAIPHRVRYLWLLLASYYFYMCWNPQYALLILTSTVITYLSGIFIDKGKSILSRKIMVGISFTLNLAILFYFKYFYFTMDNINAIRQMLNMSVLTPKFDVILPVGISFYTFQALSYTVDVYRKAIPPEKNFLKYALFVSFFPQLVAGPIERSSNLIHQISERHYFDYDRVRNGILLMLWGFFQKLVIADRAAILVDTVYNNMTAYSGAMIAIATITFALQIYCDFASYSTIARGAARVMGFELMKNFSQPYLSCSIAEFWRNWHISLSSWFKDYLYVPLGGNRKGKPRKYFNNTVVFLVSGLWHGASWHFIIWGAIHAMYQVVGGISLNFRRFLCAILNIDRTTPQYKWFQRFVTFTLTCFAWIFFRSSNMTESLMAIRKIFTEFQPWTIFDGGLVSMGLDLANIVLLIFSAVVLFLISITEHKGTSVINYIEKSHIFMRWPVYLLLVFSILIFGIYGPEFAASQFIYFQF